MISIVEENPKLHGGAIERLFDATFGPGHFAKTAERLREFSASLPLISRVALKGDVLVGVCRVWPIHIGDEKALFFGPIAVAPACQGEQIGQHVTTASIEAAKHTDYKFGCLIGDPPYFEKFGFEVVRAGQLSMPGPQDANRIMLIRLNASSGEPFPEGNITFPRDARRAEATQKDYLLKARAEE